MTKAEEERETRKALQEQKENEVPERRDPSELPVGPNLENEIEEKKYSK